jgi:membrane-associated PAP2 superfamily phosphatase
MLHYYCGRDGRAFLQQQTIALFAAAVALCAIFGDGRLDLVMQHWFYDDALGVFPLANQWMLKGVLHDAARTVSATAALALTGLSALAWTTRLSLRLHASRGKLLFVAGASLAAAALVGALKHYSSHACPWDLAVFGGTATYRPLLSAPVEATVVSGCFPAAHPLAGYAWLAVGFALYPLRPRLARRAWRLALALGTVLGAVQVARGAHFPSHVLWAAWVAWAVDIALLTACLWLPRRTPAERPIPGSTAVQRLVHTRTSR